MIMGQTGKDSILFRGNIVYDGDASEATFLHELYIKHNPKQRYPIVCDSNFSIKCMRGDTLLIEHFDTRYPYCFQVVEFIANDTLPQNIHIWRYPKSCNNWYYHHIQCSHGKEWSLSLFAPLSFEMGIALTI